MGIYTGDRKKRNLKKDTGETFYNDEKLLPYLFSLYSKMMLLFFKSSCMRPVNCKI